MVSLYLAVFFSGAVLAIDEPSLHLVADWFVLVLPGDWNIGILFDGTHIKGSPFTCNVFDPNAVKVSVSNFANHMARSEGNADMKNVLVAGLRCGRRGPGHGLCGGHVAGRQGRGHGGDFLPGPAGAGQDQYPGEWTV